jgi:hypothetical protein
MWVLLNKLYLFGIARLGVGGLVGVADGKDVVELVIGGDVETLEEELALIV